MTKHRWAWSEIDTRAIARNVEAFRDYIPASSLFMAVIKADGYGHGALPVARAAASAGADRFGVATVDEALELVEGGIKRPVQVLSEPPLESLPEVVSAGIIPAATRLAFVEELSRVATRQGVTATYHLKVDTGMGRIGIRPEDASRFLLHAAKLPSVQAEGIFSHFATADVEGDWEARNQARVFGEMLRGLAQDQISVPLKHLANTPGTILMPDAHHSMVRVGLGIYGLYPSAECRKHIKLEPALTVKARATFVKSVSIGEGVGYGLTWHAYQPCEIATLPLGYADGIPRLASNKMEVLWRGQRVEQVGRVCMDQFMVALPSGCGVAVGDEFVIIGAQDNEHIEMDELAAHAQTVNYELTCSLGGRLEKIYL